MPHAFFNLSPNNFSRVQFWHPCSFRLLLGPASPSANLRNHLFGTIHEEDRMHLNNNVESEGKWLAFGGRGTYNPQTGN
jgi:hypothetical protein